MSDYFASLMRASAPAAPGMPASARGEGAPAAQPLAAVDAAPAPRADSMLAAAVPPAPLAESTGLAAMPERAALPLAPSPEADATMPTRELVVHAAMRWVAAGEASPPRHVTAPPSERPDESSTPARANDVPAPPPAIARASDDRTAPAVDVRIDGPTALSEQASLADRAVPARAPLRAPAARDIEVSIGAIHLRVDAPPTVSAAPAAPSAAARGSLARRALRRL